MQAVATGAQQVTESMLGSTDFTTVEEEKETEDFWNLFPRGKADHVKGGEHEYKTPRLFAFSSGSGVVEAFEVC